MATPSAKPQQLVGQRLLICRPEPECHELAASLEALGATCHCLPLLERQPIADNPQRRAMIQELDNFQHIIAVSPGAARAFIAYAEDWWPQWPAGINWYGVGAGTGATITRAGLTATIPPDGHTSEHLLALPELSAPIGERVLIVKGEGGRDVLGPTLAARGARTDAMILYRRTCPDYPSTVMTRALCEFDPHAIVVLSVETLNNLTRLGENSDHEMKKRLLLVPAERVEREARAAGFSRICVAETLTPDGFAQCLPTNE